MKTFFPRQPAALLPLALAGLISLISGCGTPPPAPPPEPVFHPIVIVTPSIISVAETPQQYRMDAATHLYSKNSERIFKGIMPPFLYAVGVLRVDVDKLGEISALNWLRPPDHAPEVVAEIERTVRAAAPFPAPAKLGHASYIDTWLWDASGRFQLHTLTEGQSWAASKSKRPVKAKP